MAKALEVTLWKVDAPEMTTCSLSEANSLLYGSDHLGYQFNLPSAQLVLGIGLPIGLTKAAPDFGVFLCLSFEHEFPHH